MKKFKQVSSDRHQMSLTGGGGSFPGLMSGGGGSLMSGGGGRGGVGWRRVGGEGVGPQVYCPVGRFPGLILGEVGPQF